MSNEHPTHHSKEAAEFRQPPISSHGLWKRDVIKIRHALAIVVMPKRIVEDSDVGLKVLYEIKDGIPEIDIVAVHGIGAHPEETWSASMRQPDGQITGWLNWLSDSTMLPKFMPKIRVLNFGYKSDWFGNVVHTSLSQLAQLLWETLLDFRKDCPERPVVFVAHCFGGLIVMAALTERYERQIFESTTGLICLGTPFRGTHTLFHEVLPQMVESVLENGVNDEILKFLKPGNPSVATVRMNFFRRRRRVGDHELPILVCVSEGQESQVDGIVPKGQQAERPSIKPFLVVSSESAYLDSATNHTFQTNHFRLNKFESPNDVNFRYILKILEEIRDVAMLETAPLLKGILEKRANTMSRLPPESRARPEFHDDDWKETLQPDFNAAILSQNPLSHTERFGWNRRFKPVSSGISQDCKHIFLRDDKEVWILPMVNDRNANSGNDPLKVKMPLISTPRPRAIQFAGAGITICAFITDFDCWIFGFTSPAPIYPQRPCLGLKHLPDRDRKLKCVAVWETSISSGEEGGFILVAIGIQKKQQTGLDKGLIELWRIDRINWNEHIVVQKFEDLEDRVSQKTDSPKTLTFSKDGSILVCTTKRNQVHAWKIPTGAAKEAHERPFKKICECTRPFGAGVNAKGITSATVWLTSREHPYIICTTVPCTERNLDGGEWTFMTPLNIPLPDARTHHAFHCFLQLENLHILGVAVSPKGNMAAFLTGKGKIFLIQLIPRTTGGGLRSRDEKPPIDLGLKLGDVDEMRGAIRFSDDGTRLYAVTWKKSVEVVFSIDDQASLSSS